MCAGLNRTKVDCLISQIKSKGLILHHRYQISILNNKLDLYGGRYAHPFDILLENRSYTYALADINNNYISIITLLIAKILEVERDVIIAFNKGFQGYSYGSMIKCRKDAYDLGAYYQRKYF